MGEGYSIRSVCLIELTSLFDCIPASDGHACIDARKNQAHTCKTLGIVTKSKSIASTHVQMRPRNIIHARTINFVLATTPSALGAGRGREFD